MPQVKPQPQYRWNSPGDWLREKIEKHGSDPAALWTFLQVILPRLDSDTIQDLFQHEMAEDGYFKPLRRPK